RDRLPARGAHSAARSDPARLDSGGSAAARVTRARLARLHEMRTLLILIGVLAIVTVAPAATAGPDASSGTVTVHTSSYGRILFDGRGFALYTFSRDPRGRSSC